MKVIKFLVNTEINSLLGKIINYLIDSGHTVYIFDKLIDDHFEISEDLATEVSIIKENELNELEIDYEINFENPIIKNTLPKINVNISTIENECKLTTFVSKGSNNTIIGARQIDKNIFLNLQEFNLEQCTNELLEAYIDSIIYLSRIEKNWLNDNNYIVKNSVFKSLLRYESMQKILNNYYDSFKGHEDLFTLENLMTNRNQINYQAKSQIEFDNFGIKVNKDKLEILSLYLFVLLNSRKEGVYQYDLCYLKNKITKYIEIKLTDTYSSLLVKFNHPVYDIMYNDLYWDVIINDADVKSNLEISYDYEYKSSSRLISISFDSNLHKLYINYREDLHFFESINNYLDIIAEKFKKFISNRISFKELLELPQGYYNHCLIDWNKTQKVFHKDKPIHVLFEEMVLANPNKVAVVYENIKLTYRQLNEKSNQLARYISNNFIAKEDILIALYLDRNEMVLIAMLAVLKSGRAYLPIDLKYPEQRLKFILEDSHATLVLTNQVYLDSIVKIISGSHISTQILALDDSRVQNQLAVESIDNQSIDYFNDNMAYVIYTSGTTGNPKGVIIKHSGLVNILTSVSNEIDFSSNDNLLAVTTIAFDIAVLELLMPLLKGAQVTLTTDKYILNPKRLINLIDEAKITVLQATPSLWHLIVQALNEKNLNIKALCGGEAMPIYLHKKLVSKISKVWNVYGPTETTVWSTIKKVTPNDQIISIGSPIANTKCYVLDEDLRPLPIGVIGELYIGGIGLAKGYWRNPELTATKFIDNPFQTTSDKKNQQYSRLYKTGDLAKWLPDGNLEFIGRNDFQVKIRGHRIELKEIESVLTSYQGIEQGVVLVKELKNNDELSTDDKYLVGYYVSSYKVNANKLLNYLHSKLPDYMVPNVLLPLNKLPLTVNGKLDRNALPEPNFVDFGNYIAPRNDLEEKLCILWIDVLKIPNRKLSIRDDFFHLGGNSILAIRLVNKINSEFQSDIKISEIFTEKTVEKLSYLVKASMGEFLYKDYLINQENTKELFEPFPLSNVQQTYYLGRFNSFELSNVSTHVYSEFKYNNLDIEKLEKSFNKLINRHLALRTVFIRGEQQYIKEYPYYKIRIIELADQVALQNIRNDLSHKLYMPDVYPLFDIVVSKFNNSYILHISFDAIIIDMTSFEILFNEWIKLYNNPELILQDLEVNYRDYILQYEKVRNSELYKNAKSYWQSKLNEYNFEINLPLAIHPSEIEYPRFKRITKIIPKQTWLKLLSKVRQKNISPTALVLEVYGRALSYWTGQKTACINLTLFNRLPLHPQIDNIIGDFTVLELFNHIDSQGDTINKKLINTHQRLLKDIENNLFDGIDFQRMVRKERTIPINKIIAPVILTSVLGNSTQGNLFDLPINQYYQGVEYAISQTSQVWIDNKAYETAEGFVAEWDYVEQLFDNEIIKKMHNTYCELLEALSNMNWETQQFPIASLPVQDYKLIELANSSEQVITNDTLFGRYEKFIKENNLLANIAITDSSLEESFTYQQLLDEVEKFSRYILHVITAQPKRYNQIRLIGILSEKGYNQVISTLSIMKSGYGYLPLNIDWPLGRIEEVLEQGNTTILLISKSHYDKLNFEERFLQKYTLWIIEDILSFIKTKSNRDHQLNKIQLPIIKSDDVAYVIFTSGSTGTPKGVTTSHRSALNTIDAINKRFSITQKDVIIALSELSFDLSVYDIFGVLAVGGHIVFPNQDCTKDPKDWIKLIKKYHITIWDTVPQLAALLANEARGMSISLKSLRLFLLSGDWIPTNLPVKIKQQCPSCTVISLGGATEGAIWSIWYEIETVKNSWNSIPYGVAMPNQKIYVLNYNNMHCPIGVIGEIYIGGVGVALNYCGDEALTQERFVYHEQLGRLYKTGDLGRWHKDGYIELMGRNDFQEKLNVYRVEIEEIAAKISKLEGVAEAVVKIQKDGNQDYLLGYVVAKDQQENEQHNTDKESFKLEQLGLLKNVEKYTSIKLDFDKKEYKLRKSYRNFTEDNINASEVINLANEIIAQENSLRTNIDHQEIDIEILKNILLAISAVKFKERALPKYRFPSAGSSYSVRCFISLTKQLGDINVGYYYYNPIEHTLDHPRDEGCMIECNNQHHHEIHLVVYWPAIKPLYKESAKKLAYIEVGHMLSLLFEILRKNKVNYELLLQENHINTENTLVAKVILTDKPNKIPLPTLKLNYLRKGNREACYINKEDNIECDINKQSVFSQENELKKLLANGKAILTIEGDESLNTLVYSGLVFQKLSEALHEKDVGSCMVGFNPYAGCIYAMLLGKITSSDKEKLDSIVDLLSLKEIINQRLEQALPIYMLPFDYILLDKLPLSPNGKLAIDKLPSLYLKRDYYAPNNELEYKLVEMWSEIFGITFSEIGVKESFFSLGGNSLLAMQLITKMNNELGLDIKLIDLYKYNTIKQISDGFYVPEDSNCREEGVI